MNENDFITRAVLREEIQASEARLEARFEGRMDSLEQRLLDRVQEMIRDSETRLLQAFYGFAETNNRRLVGVEAADVILSGRISTLETRILEIEKRLNMPPAV